MVPAQASAAEQDLVSHKTYASALVPVARIDDTFKLIQTHEKKMRRTSFRWEDDEDTTLSLYEGKRLVLKYHYGVIQPPKGVPSHRARSSYFHPLKGLDGETFTDDFPSDHYHHRGFYFAWPGVFMDGQRYDMWHLVGMWTKFERILVKEDGPVFAKLVIQNGWYTDDLKVMDEVMELTVWHADKTGQALDVQYFWTPFQEIKIGPKDKKGYGGLNFRFPDREDTVVTNIDGPQKSSDLKRSPWADLSGKFDGQSFYSGVSILNHPANIEPLPGWILRTRDNYGFIGISWPGVDTFTFAPGNRYTNHYRLWLHRGDSQAGQTKTVYENYKAPPKIKVTK
jgi:hypothetical protein